MSFSLLRRGRFVVKLVAAKGIRQHKFFFTLTHFLDKNHGNKKKDMIVLVHGNHEKRPNFSPVTHFCSGFNHANLVCFFRDLNFYRKLDSLSVYFYKYERLKRFV